MPPKFIKRFFGRQSINPAWVDYATEQLAGLAEISRDRTTELDRRFDDLEKWRTRQAAELRELRNAIAELQGFVTSGPEGGPAVFVCRITPDVDEAAG